MQPSEIVRAVESCFAEHPAGLVLPDGWFGRPYDNLHQLTACTATGGTVRVELDGQLSLEFEGSGTVAVRDGAGLVIRGFTSLLWVRRAYGGREIHRQSFAAGEVRFPAPPR
jgi:hypothetical protein